MVFFHKSLKLMSLCVKHHALSLKCMKSCWIIEENVPLFPTLVMIEKHNLCDGIIRFPLTCNLWSMLCNSCTWHILNNISLSSRIILRSQGEKCNNLWFAWGGSGGNNLFNGPMFWINTSNIIHPLYCTWKAIQNWIYGMRKCPHTVYFISFNSGLYGCDTPHRYAETR